MVTAATVSAADFLKKSAESWVSDGDLKICLKNSCGRTAFFSFLDSNV